MFIIRSPSHQFSVRQGNQSLLQGSTALSKGYYSKKSNAGEVNVRKKDKKNRPQCTFKFQLRRKNMAMPAMTSPPPTNCRGPGISARMGMANKVASTGSPS